MNKNFKASLISSVIEEQFGSITKDVAKIIMSSDNSTWISILKACSQITPETRKIDQATTRKALLVLIQHGMVVVEVPPDPTAHEADVKPKPRGALLYRIDEDAVLNRLRAPKLITIVQSAYGDSGVALIQALMVHGRMSAASAVDTVVDELTSIAVLAAETAAMAGLEEEEAQEAKEKAAAEERNAKKMAQRVKLAKSTYDRMIRSRYIIPVQPLEVTIQQRSLLAAATAVPPGRKPSSALQGFSSSSSSSSSNNADSTSKPAVVVKKRSRSGSIGKNGGEDGTDGGAMGHNLLPIEMQMLLQSDESVVKIENRGDGPNSKSNISVANKLRSGSNASAASAATKDSAEVVPQKKAKTTKKAAAAAEAAAAKAVADEEALSTSKGYAVIAPAGPNEDAMAHFAGDSLNSSASAMVSAAGSSVELQAHQAQMVTIGWSQLSVYLKYQAFSKMAGDRAGLLAGCVFKIILDNSAKSGAGQNQHRSAPMCVNDIHTGLHSMPEFLQLVASGKIQGLGGGAVAGGAKGRKPAGRARSNSTSSQNGGTSSGNGAAAAAASDNGVTAPNLKRVLEVMRMDPWNILLKEVGSDYREGGAAYIVNIEACDKALGRQTIHRLAVDRFGGSSGRIIELLQRHKYMEQQHIGEVVILPAREARERLYKLYLDRWINYMEISKKSDFNPSSCSYFWTLDQPRLLQSALEHVHKSILNMRSRKAFEMEKYRYLLEQPVSSVGEEEAFNALQKRLQLLDYATLQLDSTLLVLNALKV